MKTVRDIVGGRFDIRVANAVVWKSARQFAVDVRERFFMARQLPPIVGEGGSVIADGACRGRRTGGLFGDQRRRRVRVRLMQWRRA
jgi:hypothetical protein